MRDIDLPCALEDSGACDDDAAVAHRAAVNECRGIARDEYEDLGCIAESIIAYGDPADDVRRNMVEKNEPQREAAEQVEAQVAFDRYCDGGGLRFRRMGRGAQHARDQDSSKLHSGGLASR